MANQVARNLQKLVDIKKDIKSALEEKNRAPTNEFSTYANEIRSLITGGGVEIPAVTDLVVSEEGIATWTAPDITSLAEYNPVISYLVSVNGKEPIETSNTILKLRTVLDDGTNNISVVVKAILTNNEDTSTTIEYSKPVEDIVTLSVTLPTNCAYTSASAVGNNIYIFGGYGSTRLKTILKFDTTTETITTLSATLSSGVNGTSAAAVGNNIYVFGGYNGNSYINLIQKFDTVTETRTQLSATLYYVMNGTSASAVGNNIYIFGGDNNGSNRNIIQKFDTDTENMRQSSFTLPNGCTGTSAAAVGNNVYIFGGYVNTYYNTIVKYIAG